MKWYVIGAAGVAASLSAPVKAETIVQTRTEVFNQFQAFDPEEFGTLNSVKLTIAISSPRTIGVYVPVSSRRSLTVGWTIDGAFNFRVTAPYLGAPIFTGATPISGSGSAVVALTDPYNGYAGGTFGTRASGTADFFLDPAQFTGNYQSFSIGNIRQVSGVDNGFYSSNDTLLSGIPIGARTVADGGCGYFSSHDFCVQTAYTLTYSYTPLATLAAVPEPATWGMMILGFGAVGAAMRRRRGERGRALIASPAI